jgi:hypothetical protein
MESFFLSFRRKPESSDLINEIECPDNYAHINKINKQNPEFGYRSLVIGIYSVISAWNLVIINTVPSISYLPPPPLHSR